MIRMRTILLHPAQCLCSTGPLCAALMTTTPGIASNKTGRAPGNKVSAGAMLTTAARILGSGDRAFCD